MPVEEDLKAEAQRLGFLLCGITTPQPTAHVSVFEAWLDAGRHAGMAYLTTPRARQARKDPSLVFPEARTIIVVAMRYPDPRSAMPDDNGASIGRVAAYAWGDDYHLVIPQRLQLLVNWLEQTLQSPILSKIYTDTGPILERDLAQTAGLGWIGKNTNLINPHHGSYFFLAEIFLSCELKPDPPFTLDLCGSCSRCIEACPTNCILPNRTLDAGQCISYLTIENKGAVPPELRPKMQDWVFGCDICQTVCPWNDRFSDQTAGFGFNPRAGVAHPRLRELLALEPPEFNQQFKNSPLQRTRRRGLLRNAAITAGNLANRDDVPALANLLFHEPEPLARAHAAWALGMIKAAAARAALEDAAKTETDLTVLQEIRAALAYPS